jgi:hypothetical protein
MIRFGSAINDGGSASEAARKAARAARAGMGDVPPKIALVFASAAYDDLDQVPLELEGELGGAPIIGGTSGGCVFGPRGISARGVSVVVIGGDGISATVVSESVRSSELLEAVPLGEQIARAGDAAAQEGRTEFTCLAFAPFSVDGEAFVAAVRKGAGARAQLAGGLIGDDLTFDRARVFAKGGASADRMVLAGLFTRTPLGVAARHGWSPAGPTRTITRTEGCWLVQLDGRPAFDVWLEDTRAVGGNPPPGRGRDVAVYLANHYELGLDVGSLLPLSTAAVLEPIIRAPFSIRHDGAVLLSASVAEQTPARVMHAEPADLLRAAHAAAESARGAAGGGVAGALVFACSGRLAALGDRFVEEQRAIADRIAAPIGGSCVFGEIARARRDVDAFHNTTVVVAAIPNG